MLISRLVDINLGYFFREDTFSPLWKGEYDYELSMTGYELTLTKSDEEGYTLNNHKLYVFSNHAPLIGKDEAEYAIKLYKNGFEITTGNYIIDYIRGRAIFSDAYAATLTDLDIITADFSYLYIKVTKDSPEEVTTSSDNYRLPLLIIEGLPFKEVPFEIGNSKGKFRRQYLFHILAENSDQRDDILQIILEHFRRELPLIDYTQDLPFLEDGQRNPIFVKNVIGNIAIVEKQAGNMKFSKPSQATKYWGYVNATLEAMHDI